MSLALSIVIPSYNSRELLRRCLTSLEQQSASLSHFEVIVVDDGSQDGTMAMLQELQQTSPLQLRMEYQPNAGPATARNRGVAQARCDWIGFLDADVQAHPDWVKYALQLIQCPANIAGFEGCTEVSNRHLLTPFTHQTENMYGGRYPTCNMILRKTFCRFQSSYRIAFREDTDLAFCILEAGYQIPFVADLIVYHPPLSPSYLRPLKLAKRYYYDGLLKQRFPLRYKSHLDAHRVLGFEVPHIKKKVYGGFLASQLAFLFSFLALPWTLDLFLGCGSLFFMVYGLSYWMSLRHTEPASRTLSDMLMLALVLNIVPWVLFYYLNLGRRHFAGNARFSSEAWLAELGLPPRSKPLEIVLISTADWDHPFWTNKQHIASRLALRGHRVLYVESLGLRQLTTSYRDLKRVFLRLKRSLMGTRELQTNVFVWSPLVIPMHRFRWVRQLNWLILSRYIEYFCRKLQFQQPLLWSYNPIIGPLTARLKFSRIIYHCVDELKEAPGMPKTTLESEEESFCRQADLIFTTAPKLYASRKIWNPQTYFLPNPCDFAHFHQATTEIAVAPELQRIPEPRLGFVGALSHYKVDAELLQKLARHTPPWQIVLLGQIGEGEPGARFDEIRDFPNVHVLGPKNYKDLPHYLKGFQVALLPCPLNGYTANMFPLKFFEYLAAGLPVVSTALPALEDYQQVCYWCKTHEAFLAAIPDALADEQTKSARLQEGIHLASQNTWDQRVDSMLEILTRVQS